MNCNNCGREIPDASEFCPYCGARQSAQPSAENAGGNQESRRSPRSRAESEYGYIPPVSGDRRRNTYRNVPPLSGTGSGRGGRYRIPIIILAVVLACLLGIIGVYTLLHHADSSGSGTASSSHAESTETDGSSSSEKSGSEKEDPVLKQYQKVLDSTSSLGAFDPKLKYRPMGHYRYALVTMKKGEDQSLLLAQDLDDGTSLVRVYYYDSDQDHMYAPESNLRTGISSGGIYRAEMGMQSDGNGIYLSTISKRGGSPYIERWTREGSRLVSSRDVSGMSQNEIEWHDAGEELTD